MRGLIIYLTAAVLFTLAGVASADSYDITVSRISDNIYKSPEGVFIQTKLCLEFALSEQATLDYDEHHHDNKITFANNKKSCRVQKVFK